MSETLGRQQKTISAAGIFARSRKRRLQTTISRSIKQREDRHLEYQRRQQASAEPVGMAGDGETGRRVPAGAETEQSAFPNDAIRAAGYDVVWRGQRTWNGVAILDRGAEPILIRDTLPGDPADEQSKYIRPPSTAF